MLLATFYIVVGLVLLVYGADRFVAGAAAIAGNLGVSPLLIGLTIVGFGTSAPEMLVAAIASFEGTPQLAIGNAVGSNIANIGLVLGVTAVLAPFTVDPGVVRKEFPVMLAAMVLAVALMWDLQLGRIDGAILALGMAALIAFTIWLGLRGQGEDPLAGEVAEAPAAMRMSLAVRVTIIGLVLLLGGSNLLVAGAVDVAIALGVSELVIGLTIVAIGTSLPELAASATGALKGEPEIAIGNVIGSNMFNMLGVLCLPGLIQPTIVEAMVLNRDCVMMLGLTGAMWMMSFRFQGPGQITRIDGSTLLAAFVVYQMLIVFSARGL